MINLTEQQQAILSEGICPLCYAEVKRHAIDSADWTRGCTWICLKCLRSYVLPDQQNRPHAVIEYRCQNCNREVVSIAPVGVHFLECGYCGKTNEV